MIKALSIAVLSIGATVAHAGSIAPPPSTVIIDPEPSLFLGLSWTFGNSGQSSAGTGGLTLKLLSTNEKDKAAAIAGVTWNFDGTFGCDIGIAYVDDVVVGFSYDICKRGPQISLGGTNDPDEIVVSSSMSASSELQE